LADPSVSKVLVANRGEIALRIMRTCREMRIPTVAVFSEPDRRAPHVAFAEERVELSGANPRAAYLDIPQMIAAARAQRADAVHPGYGFLAENPAFVEACVEAGITFIGPTASSMRAMGDKIEARRRMQEAGVPVVPGTVALSDDATALADAERIGYPVLVKASAGGGGIGMRVAKTAAELPAAIEGCRRAAKSSFGNDSVYLEQYLDHPRHIEMQILADRHGTTLALGERDCSIQRRHQKLVEETPAVGLKLETRAAMAEAAVRAAQAVGYQNAGTIEFIFSAGQFYFLEMNTRLQVEHPITEVVRGMDLVREQIRIARGERLEPDAVPAPRGHAIEFRVNAEDPLRNFLPSPRPIRRYAPPTGPGVRVDSGIHPHQEVSPHFDPLLLKLIVWGADRDQAIARGRRALQELVLTGVASTIPFHRSLLEEPDFQKGQISTYFIQEHPSLLERVRTFSAERSPFESFYGSPELAAAIGAIVAVTDQPS
jgi:acetyl-CoA carboxylase biotin carboxylase subunit